MQAEAILNMRLRALRKLEEIEIRTEHDRLEKEKAELQEAARLRRQRNGSRIAGRDPRDQGDATASKTELGRRRADFAEAPAIDVDLDQAMIEKEPVTVVLSDKGWIRALKGHQNELEKLPFKAGDSLMRAIQRADDRQDRAVCLQR